MDRLMALQAFARVVELGGFTKASDSLQMSKTTVSDLVQSLEKHLGVRLLQRTTRRVTVTADGAAFYERCAHILADLDEAEASVMQVARRGERQTARRHARCAREAFHHPKTSAVPRPLSRSAIGIGDGTSDRCICWKRESIVWCASACRRTRAWSHDESVRCPPSAVRALRTCASMEPRAGLRTCPPTDASPSFQIAPGEPSTGNSRDGGQKVQLTLDGVLAVNDHDAYVVASLMSFGIVKVANYVARPYLESGQLTQVLADWTSEQSPISVMYPQSRHLSAKVRIFVDWVSELIQQDPIFQAP